MGLSVSTAHLFNGPDNVGGPFHLFTLGPGRRVSLHISALKYAAAGRSCPLLHLFSFTQTCKGLLGSKVFEY
jgi:hypothetical protein